MKFGTTLDLAKRLYSKYIFLFLKLCWTISYNIKAPRGILTLAQWICAHIRYHLNHLHCPRLIKHLFKLFPKCCNNAFIYFYLTHSKKQLLNHKIVNGSKIGLIGFLNESRSLFSLAPTRQWNLKLFGFFIFWSFSLFVLKYKIKWIKQKRFKN